MLGVGFVGQNPILLLLLALLGQAGMDPILFDLGSKIADFARWLGVKLTGRLTRLVVPSAFTVATPEALPESRPLDFLLISGDDELRAFLADQAAAKLIAQSTRMVVLSDRESFCTLQRLFPGQVFFAWLSSKLEIKNPKHAPNELHVFRLGAIHIEADPNDPALNSLAKVLKAAGLAWVIEPEAGKQLEASIPATAVPAVQLAIPATNRPYIF